jgi:hypothetical protein
MPQKSFKVIFTIYISFIYCIYTCKCIIITNTNSVVQERNNTFNNTATNMTSSIDWHVPPRSAQNVQRYQKIEDKDREEYLNKVHVLIVDSLLHHINCPSIITCDFPTCIFCNVMYICYKGMRMSLLGTCLSLWGI